jgi:hypothetical protein
LAKAQRDLALTQRSVTPDHVAFAKQILEAMALSPSEFNNTIKMNCFAKLGGRKGNKSCWRAQSSIFWQAGNKAVRFSNLMISVTALSFTVGVSAR